MFVILFNLFFVYMCVNFWKRKIGIVSETEKNMENFQNSDFVNLSKKIDDFLVYFFLSVSVMTIITTFALGKINSLDQSKSVYLEHFFRLTIFFMARAWIELSGKYYIKHILIICFTIYASIETLEAERKEKEVKKRQIISTEYLIQKYKKLGLDADLLSEKLKKVPQNQKNKFLSDELDKIKKDNK